MLDFAYAPYVKGVSAVVKEMFAAAYCTSSL
jgi:hypothetical protein